MRVRRTSIGRQCGPDRGYGIMRADFIYVGVCKLTGSVIAACCDDVGYEKDTAKYLADWASRGLAVERLSNTEYQTRIRAHRAEGPDTGGPSK